MRPITLALVLAACGSKTEKPVSTEPAAPPHDAALPHPAAGFAELADYPRIDAVRTVYLPRVRDVPRFDVGGPALAGDLAIVASSQFGFAAIDYRRGTVAWTKPAGLHVAPPLVHGTSIVLVGECVLPQNVPAGEVLLGCLRVVTTTGSDEANLAIRGKGVEEFRDEPGVQRLFDAGERAIRWRRGERAVQVDLLTGVAKPASADDPPLVVSYKGNRREIVHRDGKIVANDWQTENEYTALVGAVYMPEQSPLVRVATTTSRHGSGWVHVIDMDATGSLRATVARPTPGIDILAHGVGRHGDAAIAVRLDRSLRRDVISGYAANGLLLYVHPLPLMKRVDPIGIAVAEDAVVVFHDGETLTVLPELSAPPTAPGATKGEWQNPTP